MDPVTSNPNPLEEENPLKQIRTFQGDIAEALKRQQESLVSIQRREHLKQASTPVTVDGPSAETKKRQQLFLLFLGSLILIGLGGTGVWFTYKEFVKKSTTPAIVAPLNRFISANSEANVDLQDSARETLINTLTSATEGTSAGELKHIILRRDTGTDKPLISSSEFMTILGSHAPGSLVRAFDPLFMFGALGESHFIIIKLVSFENAFPGMLVWEATMAQDIGPLFSTAPIFRDIPAGTTFVDITDRNKDIRALKFQDQPVLLYSFFDNNMLIITDKIETLRTLIDRLSQEKLSR